MAFARHATKSFRSAQESRERRGGQLQAGVEFSFAVFPDLRRFSRQAKVVRRLLWGAPTDWGPVPGCCAIRTRLALSRKYDPKSSVIYSLAKRQVISRMPAADLCSPVSRGPGTGWTMRFPQSHGPPENCYLTVPVRSTGPVEPVVLVP
jgi:hypothetical protein